MSDIVDRLEERAVSYEQSGPSAHHTAALLREAKVEIEDLTRANQILQALIGNRDKEVDRLRKGIQDYLDGNYVNPRKFRAVTGQCAHGQYWFEDCGECIDFHFADLLTPSTPSPADRVAVDK